MAQDYLLYSLLQGRIGVLFGLKHQYHLLRNRINRDLHSFSSHHRKAGLPTGRNSLGNGAEEAYRLGLFHSWALFVF